MGTGYIRNDTANNIADGNVIDAADLDGEFDAIQSAFNGSTGHSHDGTSGEGPLITSAGLAAGAVTASAIANDSIALGTKTTGNYVADGAVSGVGLTGSASAEGATFTVTSNATDANTASTIVARDASGNFSAGTVTADLTGNVTGNVTGNADTATALATGRTIGMTGDVVWTSASFDGSGNVTGTATIQPDSVVLGTDTTGNYVATISAGTGISGSSSSEGGTPTISLSHLGIESLTDPNADRIFMWDDSAGAAAFLTAGTNLSISGTTISSTDTTYSAGSGLDLAGTTFSVEADLRDGITHVGLSTDYVSFTSTAQIDFYVNSLNKARLEADGDFHADGDVIAYSTTISDERLKTDIVKIDTALDKVAQLNGYTFTYKQDGKKSAGVIAQEVEKVLPSAVSEKELPLKINDGVAYKTVQYDQLVGLLIEAVNELQEKVSKLEGK
jgi:hypothetical protein